MVTVNARGSLATDPIRNFRFLVEFLPHGDGATYDFRPTLGFTSVSGLSVQTDSIPYREGGYNTTVHQIPGQSTFSPLTFQRGVLVGTPQHWNWMKRLFSINGTGPSTVGGNFRVDLNVFVLAHPSSTTAASDITLDANPGHTLSSGSIIDDNVMMKFKVWNAWPTMVAYSDLSAGDNALLVEQMTLVHEGFDCAIADKFTETVKDVSFA